MSDYPRCRTCKHYLPITEFGHGGIGTWNFYDDVPDTTWPGWCGLLEGPANPDDSDVSPPKRMAIANDGSSYHASLLVTPDFGCVLHEPKDCGCQ